MEFTSAQFFIIVITTVILYFIIPERFRWYVLLISSGYFYMVAAGKRAAIAALITIGITYFFAIWIEKSAEDRKKKKLYLAVALVIVIGILVIFKLKPYITLDVSWLIVPLGVSYYTFSLTGYLADVYFKKEEAEKNILKLALYTLYFPKIIQGPISKFRVIGPKLIEGHSFDYQRVCFGLQLIVWGYFKKLVIADRAVLLTETVFGDFTHYDGGGAILLLVTFLATIRHYCDFSGYMDIVIGISQIMGIDLEDNFRQPFFFTECCRILEKMAYYSWSLV